MGYTIRDPITNAVVDVGPVQPGLRACKIITVSYEDISFTNCRKAKTGADDKDAKGKKIPKGDSASNSLALSNY